MMLMTILPFLAALVLWAVLLWLFLQPAIDWIQGFFVRHDSFHVIGKVLGMFGLEALKAIMAPLIAMWLLLPLIIASALIFISVFAMPAIERHVTDRHYPDLEKRRGGNMWGSAGISLLALLVFLVLWILTLPFSVILPLGFLIQPLLWGWLTYYVMGYDALATHASVDERKNILRQHRWPLLALGTLTGAMGTGPMLIWMGGVLSVVFFPFLAAFSIWLYVLAFIFTGLWFQHYCLAALAAYRQAEGRVESIAPFIETESK
jgi:hypothetical protein